MSHTSSQLKTHQRKKPLQHTPGVWLKQRQQVIKISKYFWDDRSTKSTIFAKTAQEEKLRASHIHSYRVSAEETVDQSHSEVTAAGCC